MFFGFLPQNRMASRTECYLAGGNYCCIHHQILRKCLQDHILWFWSAVFFSFSTFGLAVGDYWQSSFEHFVHSYRTSILSERCSERHMHWTGWYRRVKKINAAPYVWVAAVKFRVTCFQKMLDEQVHKYAVDNKRLSQCMQHVMTALPAS